MKAINYKRILSREFYNESTISVAQNLLGKYLVRKIGDSLLIGKIVETEAYLGIDDEAAHSFIGKTKRNEVLFGEAGFTYVHSIHRFHCIDIVTEQSENPSSVLIRALEPVEGLDLMKKFRNTEIEINLTNGPGKLCEAFNIKRELNNIDVTNPLSEIMILDNDPIAKTEFIRTSRIGISKAKELSLRFYIKGNNFVSKK
jgi:DNA-3-methyladenine glycosylase